MTSESRPGACQHLSNLHPTYPHSLESRKTQAEAKSCPQWLVQEHLQVPLCRNAIPTKSPSPAVLGIASVTLKEKMPRD